MSVYDDRRKRLADVLDEHEATEFVSTAGPDIFYYTGCLDVGGFLLMARDGRVTFITNAHDAPQARAELTDVEIRAWRPGERSDPLLFAALAEGEGRVLSESVQVADACRAIGRPFANASNELTHLRRVKEPAELEVIRAVARIVETGMTVVRDGLRPGVREIDVAAEAERVMRRLGSDGRVFETKIESGPKSAMPSTYAGERYVAAGDLVLVDIGPRYRGYFGDLSRTFAIGEPSPAQRQLLEVVLGAEQAGIAAIRDGISGEAVDGAARGPMREARLEHAFLHHTGHTLGLAGDSLSLLQPEEQYPLRAGECVTVEPGLYVDGIGGVRIEDEVLVTADGSELLTSFDRHLESLILYA